MRRYIGVIVVSVLFLLSVVGWWGSYCYPFTVDWPVGHRDGLAVVDGGTIGLVWHYDSVAPSSGYWPYAFGMNDEDAYLGRFNESFDRPRVLGFNVGQVHDTRPGIDMHFWLVRVPFWFPTVVWGLLMIVFWRRLRGMRVERAFPVEVGKRE